MQLSEIQDLCKKGKIRWSTHCIERMQERDITRADVKNCIMSGEIIEDYPEDFPHPSCLIFRYTLNDKMSEIYRVNLITPRGMDDKEIEQFHSNLREVMLYIKYSKDKQKLNEIVATDEKFKNVERQAADIINTVTKSKLKYPEGKEQVDMCLAIDQMRSESEIKGAIEMCRDLGITLTETVQRIAERKE